ncbi:uncharacterized protein LOC134183702 isoform X2 [Corticium candelabrum]|uniref:uncharacterized protein LOC134183702 isoform X2 n=1 Tax=Corticium candelabrum TaxID=121492 RepID=UPI002E26F881|nr:uncharacterized protein LOC134183702 isoform X2 [Corticium candelabrum]
MNLDNEEGPILVTGPNDEALDIFNSTLMEVASPEIKERDREPRVLASYELLRKDLNFRDAKYFLVMPRASRTLVYIEGHRSSMYKEIQHMCSTNKDGKKRVFIVLYRNEDVPGGCLYDSQIKYWWDPGPQKELEQFAKMGHLISFQSKPNRKQENAIREFLGYKPRPTLSSSQRQNVCEVPASRRRCSTMRRCKAQTDMASIRVEFR